MDKSTRIRMVQQVRHALKGMDWEDVDLVLGEFGFGQFPSDDPDLTLTGWLHGHGDDDDLLALAGHLGVPSATEAVERAGGGAAAAPTSEPDPLFLFGSHLSSQRAFVGQVEAALGQYGITLFVAHDSIPIDAEWEPEIAEALRTCDAGAVFVHQGLHDSYYCMQEVGWLLGRDIPIARLLFDDAPKGLLGSRQGINARALKPDEVAAAVLGYVADKPELRPQLATSLVHAMKGSPAFRVTDAVWARLHTIADLTLGQAAVLVEAAEEQDQVYRAGFGGYGGANYRGVIADYLAGQPAAGPLAERIARLRKHKDSGVNIELADAD